MSTSRESKLRALFLKHGRLRLHAPWPYGFTSTPDPGHAIRFINTAPYGHIETTAGKTVAKWTNVAAAHKSGSQA